MDTAQWPQGIGIVEQQVDQNSRPVANVDKKPRPPKEQAVNCPRCNSTNTKFCYYNNYSLSQPRYLCKTCRRYWTDGGSLRNVPVGGGSRKNKRPHSSNNNSSSINNTSKKIHPDLSPPPPPPTFSPHQNPKIHQGQDLNLAYNPFHINGISEFSALQVGQNPNDHPSSSSSQFSMMELLKSGGNNMSSRGLSSFMSDASPMFSSGFQIPVHDQFKPSLSFTLDGLESGYGNLQGLNLQNHANQSRVVLPFEELKPVSANDQFEQDKGQGEGNGYWNGMLAGGSW